MSNRIARVLGMLALALLFPVLTAHADERDAAITRAQTATRVLADIMKAPDKAIPHDLLRDAYAIAVIPNVIKVGLVFGGRHGDGLIAVKSPDGTWSNPVFLSLTGGSVGFQAGVSSTDVVLVFRTRRGVDSIVNGKFTIGADAHAAAGPVGRNLNASTDAAMQAEIYSYSRSRGLFAGVSLDGAVLRMDDDANAAIYGPGITPRRIFEGGVSDVPAPVVHFRDELEEVSQ
ncbi:MAG TPA: lipid-binding SYLF domain-containing protein [Rhodanobacteraceae bacterium]|nr:lipid-binding SYLF domain-containing protein [Rhodanobacteraceae bacterium]